LRKTRGCTVSQKSRLGRAWEAGQCEPALSVSRKVSGPINSSRISRAFRTISGSCASCIARLRRRFGCSKTKAWVRSQQGPGQYMRWGDCSVNSHYRSRGCAHARRAVQCNLHAKRVFTGLHCGCISTGYARQSRNTYPPHYDPVRARKTRPHAIGKDSVVV